jgi:hypothetical protein
MNYSRQDLHHEGLVRYFVRLSVTSYRRCASPRAVFYEHVTEFKVPSLVIYDVLRSSSSILYCHIDIYWLHIPRAYVILQLTDFYNPRNMVASTSYVIISRSRTCLKFEFRSRLHDGPILLELFVAFHIIQITMLLKRL